MFCTASTCRFRSCPAQYACCRYIKRAMYCTTIRAVSGLHHSRLHFPTLHWYCRQFTRKRTTSSAPPILYSVQCTVYNRCASLLSAPPPSPPTLGVEHLTCHVSFLHSLARYRQGDKNHWQPSNLINLLMEKNV